MSKIFYREIKDGLFQLSNIDCVHNAELGEPCCNSYLVIGCDKALLFDLAIDDENLFDFASKLTDKPIMTVLSHAHPDHCYHLDKLNEVWLHTKDEELLTKGFLVFPPVCPLPTLHFLKNGQSIDLGGRKLTVVNVAGHTNGSILLYDVKTNTLLSGDTVARRLLYGLHGFVPFESFIDSLVSLKRLDFDSVYSAHDCHLLKRNYVDFMIQQLLSAKKCDKTINLPPIGEMYQLTYGEEHSEYYFSMAFLKP